MTPPPIPLHRTYLTGRERQYVGEAIASGDWAGDGPFAQRCHALLEKRLGIKRVMLTPSCTDALEMAAMLAGIAPGDEVILPSFTFVSTAQAIVRAGGLPVFVDVCPDTMNLDASLVQRAITPRTRAIIAVHYAGVGCAMQDLVELAEQHDLLIIEDAAQAVNGWCDDRALGSIGALGAFSFHATKNYSCGEGGALCINDPQLIERAEILRNKGTNRQQFFRGEVDKYTWVDVGSSFLLGELPAALLLAQLESLDPITELRRRRYEQYLSQLAPLEERGHLRLPVIPGGCRSSYHLFHVLLTDPSVRDPLIAHLREAGIQAAFHFVPLHSSPMGRRVAPDCPALPVTEQMSERLLRLPLFPELTEGDQQRVVDEVHRFFQDKS